MKPKIVLLSFVVVAILGTALAFKARTYNAIYCTRTYVAGGPATSFCPNCLKNRIEVPGTPTIYATSLDAEGNAITSCDQCTEELPCPRMRLLVD
jgi:hypothetical protein